MHPTLQRDCACLSVLPLRAVKHPRVGTGASRPMHPVVWLWPAKRVVQGTFCCCDECTHTTVRMHPAHTTVECLHGAVKIAVVYSQMCTHGMQGVQDSGPGPVNQALRTCHMQWQPYTLQQLLLVLVLLVRVCRRGQLCRRVCQ